MPFTQLPPTRNRISDAIDRSSHFVKRSKSFTVYIVWPQRRPPACRSQGCGEKTGYSTEPRIGHRTKVRPQLPNDLRGGRDSSFRQFNSSCKQQSPSFTANVGLRAKLSRRAHCMLPGIIPVPLVELDARNCQFTLDHQRLLSGLRPNLQSLLMMSNRLRETSCASAPPHRAHNMRRTGRETQQVRAAPQKSAAEAFAGHAAAH